MAWTKTKDDADTYYKPNNHIKALDWKGFSNDERKGAFAQAVREMQVYLGRELADPTAGDTFRDDYAIFEQALFILQNTPHTREGEGKSIELAEDDEGTIIDREGVTISPMAQRYLCLNRIKLVRG